jgi:hypothetical protein
MRKKDEVGVKNINIYRFFFVAKIRKLFFGNEFTACGPPLASYIQGK